MHFKDFSKELYRETVFGLRKTTPAPMVGGALRNILDWFSNEETLAKFSDDELVDFLLNRIQYRVSSIYLVAKIIVLPRINCISQIILGGDKAVGFLSKIGENKLSYLIKAMEDLGDVNIVPTLKVFEDVNKSVKAKEIIYYKSNGRNQYLTHMRQQTTYALVPIYPQYPAVQFVPYNPFPMVQFQQSQLPNYNVQTHFGLQQSQNQEVIPTITKVEDILQFLDSGLDDSKMVEMSSSFMSPTLATPQRVEIPEINFPLPEVWDLDCGKSSNINRY